MNEDNSTRLAEVYQAYVKQIITIYPHMWRHEPYGNWYLVYKFGE